MENFNLTDEEQKLFAEWFSNLDNDKQAKLSFKNVKQFLSSYQLKDDDLEKIMNICGAKRLSYFGRSQFYIALKLVSLAQNSYELSLENLNKPNLPLPKKINTTSSFNDSQQFNTSFNNIHEASSNLNSLNSNNSICSTGGILLPPPKSNRIKNQKLSPSFCKFCNKSLITSSDQYKNLKSFVLICPNCKNTNQSQDNLDLSPNNDLNSLSNEFNNTNNDYKLNLNNKTDQSSSSSDNSRCSSTELYETIDNSQVFEKLKQWEKLENQNRELGEIDEAKHCLLNDEDELLETQLNNKICLNINQYTPNYFENDQLNTNQLNYSTEIDKIEEEETDEDDVFMINDDQIKYYSNKFYQLLSNKQDILLAGCNVKNFFEKSKLDVNDLKHIWNLSDLDNDGNLTIVEFCIAMHLIVLKRNKVPLPDKLPSTLSNDKLMKLLLDNNLINKSYNHISKINISSNDSLNCNQQQSKNSFDNNYLNSPSTSSNLSSSNSNLIIKNTFNLRNNQDNINDTNSNLNTTSTSNEIIYSPNHEWTKFNNSPFTTNQLIKNQQQINSQTNDVKLNLMTPANFIDRIELDPALIHPLPVKISSVNKDRNTFHKNSLTLVNHPPYPPRPRAHGHARSSSLDLNRKFMNNNSTTSNNFHQGAFINYRKHIQQQQINRKQSITDDSKPILDKQYYLNYLKTKYSLPQLDLNNTANLVNSLKERNFLMECIYEKLIDEFASTLEKLNN